jgi:hypothetical protein
VKRTTFVLGTWAALAFPVAATAKTTLTFADAVARMFTAPAVQSAWFTAEFLAAVPLARAQAIVGDLTTTLGAYQSIQPNGSRYTVTFARGTIQAEGTLDASGAFAGLLFSRMQSAAVADRLAGLFHTKPIPVAWFSAAMLGVVPIGQIEDIIAAMTTKYGAFDRVTPAKDGSYDVAFANGSASAIAFLDAEGEFVGLLFQPH